MGGGRAARERLCSRLTMTRCGCCVCAATFAKKPHEEASEEKSSCIRCLTVRSRNGPRYSRESVCATNSLRKRIAMSTTRPACERVGRLGRGRTVCARQWRTTCVLLEPDAPMTVMKRQPRRVYVWSDDAL